MVNVLVPAGIVPSPRSEVGLVPVPAGVCARPRPGAAGVIAGPAAPVTGDGFPAACRSLGCGDEVGPDPPGVGTTDGSGWPAPAGAVAVRAARLRGTGATSAVARLGLRGAVMARSPVAAHL